MTRMNSKKRWTGLLGLLLAVIVLLEMPMLSQAEGVIHYVLYSEQGVLYSATGDSGTYNETDNTGLLQVGTNIALEYTSGGSVMVYVNNVEVKRVGGINSGEDNYDVPITAAEYNYTCECSDNIAKLYLTAVGNTASVGNTTGSNSTAGGSGHNHGYTWKVTTVPTATTDGVLSHICECGVYDDAQVMSANSYYLNYILMTLTNAKEGEKLTFRSELWNSFPKSIMQVLSERRDLDVTFEYKYGGLMYQVNIPAGAAVDTFSAWYGPMKLIALYNGVEVSR